MATRRSDKTRSDRPLRIALIGAGAWGKNLARTLAELQRLVTVCDRNADLLKKYEALYPRVKKTLHAEEVLQDESTDAVVIATPPATHYALAKQALSCGKHVLVEKPLALSAREGEELVELARRQKKILMVGHLLHYHNAVIKLKELVEKGELGKIRYVYSNRLNIGKIRSEENILWSFAPHDISVILMLLDEFPEAIHTAGASYLQRGIMDTTFTMMDFPSGVKAHIFVSWLHPFKEQKLVVVGERKMAVFDDVGEEKLVLYPHRVDWIGRVPVASKAEAEKVPIADDEPLVRECRHFIECIRHGRIPKTDGEEGLRVLRVLDLSQQSMTTGKTLRPDSYEKEPGSYFVHESSCVDEDVAIGTGTQIWHFSHVLKGSRIGKNCRIGQNVVIGPRVLVGDNCKIQNNVSLYEGVTLEDEVFCGPSMVFTNVRNPRSAIPRMKEHQKTLVRKGATIGANATILCGVTIGRYGFIGAGAVVTKNVPDYGLVYGNPASLEGWMCECGIALDFKDSVEACCLQCERSYVLEDGRVRPKAELWAGARVLP
jgi:UDP-2-acetamido-3-amino-2,3-dideoxy-glucuronate N-acetyltransferase